MEDPTLKYLQVLVLTVPKIRPSSSEVSASEQESGKSYEVSKDTSSSSSTKGDMPISLIICVIVMVLIFGYGYYKRKNEE